MRLLTLLFTSLLSTGGLAQINVDAPALTYLADQLDELALGAGHPFTDLGPTRFIYTNNELRWRPSLMGLNWSGRSVSRDAVGLFSPGHNYTTFGNRNDYHASFAGAPDLYALRLRVHPTESYRQVNLYADYEYFANQREGAARRGEAHHFNVSAYTNIGNVQIAPNVQFWLDEGRRSEDFTADAQRLDVKLRVHEYYNYTDIDWNLQPNLLHETFSRRYGPQKLSGTRTMLGATAGATYRRLKWLQPGARFDYARTTDDWSIGERGFLREEGQWAFTAAAQVTYYPLRLEVEQQYRYQKLDGERWLPSVQLHGYADEARLNLTVFGNRGGAYRNPLLSEEHLSFTEREVVTTDLKTEDFWRYGLELQSNYKQVNFNVEAVQRDYRRYTTVRYTSVGEISIGQVDDARRATVTGEVSCRLSSIHRTELRASANFRYDFTDLSNTEGLLLPARHAGWVRVQAEHKLGDSELLGLSGGVSFMRTSAPVQVPVGQGLSRSRLDLDIRLDIRPKKAGSYFLALRGEQLTADGDGVLSPTFGVDDEALGALPVGNMAGLLGGRWFSLAFGAGF